ncbi:phospholipase D-like domain-containing protein [Chlamydia crocodili]|uniref:phospholipase D n=1 Tax=Chlamydia crocodili TaxID=2766982 RepID=A0ABX8CD98_9CHLA|nr:phospholipase D-like domain-containing protein [Chlamydia crocodili]QVE48995.1 phosphatidylserine/phosphatidylglycerophosphate/cardiolipin synthase family protein [Chlamydia crocodili]
MKKKTNSKLKIILTVGSLLFFGVLTKSQTPDTFQTFTASQEPVIYSKQCGDDSLKVLCDAIDSAEKNIFLRIYRLSAPEIVTSLANQANAKRNVAIHYEKMAKIQEFPKNKYVTLVEHPSEGRKLMHQKALAIDDKQVWLGSANYTHVSFLQDSNLIIGLKSKELCQYIKNESCGNCVIDGQNVQYFSLPGDQGKALSAVLQTLRTAKKTIRLAMFALTYPPVFRELNEAKKRGVDVKILIDKDFKKLSIKQIQALKDSSLTLHTKTTRYRLHHKFAIVDQKILIAGSVNWSEAGFCINSEDMFILDNLTNKQVKKLNRIWEDLEKQSALSYPISDEDQKVIQLPKEKRAA